MSVDENYFYFRERILFSLDGGSERTVHFENVKPRLCRRKGELNYARDFAEDLTREKLMDDRGVVVIGDGENDWLLFRNLETLAKEKHNQNICCVG